MRGLYFRHYTCKTAPHALASLLVHILDEGILEDGGRGLRKDVGGGGTKKDCCVLRVFLTLASTRSKPASTKRAFVASNSKKEESVPSPRRNVKSTTC